MFYHLRPVFFGVLCFVCCLRLPAQDPRLADSLSLDLKAYGKRDTVYLDKMQALQASLLFVMPDSVLRLARQSIHVADSLGDTKRKARAINISGNCFKIMGLFDRAMTEFVEALKLFEQVGDQKWLANMHSNIGLMHLQDDNFDQALREQEIALSIRSKIGYNKGISGTYNTIGNIYSAQGKLPEALHAYELALDSAVNEGPFFEALYIGNIGNTYGQLGQYEACREMNRQALATHEAMGLPQETARDLHNIGEAYLREGMTDSSIFFNRQAINIALEIQAHEIIQACAVDLMKAYSDRKEFALAAAWADTAMVAKDSLNAQNLSSETRTMELLYRIEMEEAEIQFSQEKALLQKDADLARQRVFMIVMAFGVLALLVAGGVLWRLNRSRKVANAKLEFKVAERTHALSQANAQLSQEMQHTEAARQSLQTFIYRSSHDLKGPLTSMMGLVQIAQDQPDSATYLPMIGAKAEQLDGVLQMLIDKVEVEARTPEHAPVDLPAMWAELQSELSSRNGYDQVAFELHAGGDQAIVTDPRLLKIALRQLLHNAIDFRRKDAADNACNLRVTGGGSHWRISVADRGIGMPAGLSMEMFARGSNQSTGAGLGLSLVREIAGKLGAEVVIEAAEVGTVVRLGVGT